MRTELRDMLLVFVLWTIFMFIMYSRQKVYTQWELHHIRMRQNEMINRAIKG